MKYLVVSVNPHQARTFPDQASFLAAMAAEGKLPTGRVGGSHLKPVLRGQPDVNGLAGPMYQDEDTIRYETWPAYEFYST